ncbi:MAG: methyltransferase [Gammaproteobacteria bacterium]|nr:methyltransferase [Gammaproteobacteria bacterium]
MQDSRRNTEPVVATVRYLENDRDLALYRASVAGGELVEHEGNYLDVPVSIENARSGLPVELDTDGFSLIKHPTAVTDFHDDSELPLYEREVISLLKDLMDASDVLVFDHTRRSSSADLRKELKLREASSVIHNDYSANSGRVRLQDFLADQNLENESIYRDREFSIVNLWRSTAGTIKNYPLAMCHAQSVAPADLVPIKRVGKERVGELQLVLHNESHRWAWYPDMRDDEVLVFKTYDTRETGCARFVPHTSFDCPGIPPDSPPRQSIETRCFVFQN